MKKIGLVLFKIILGLINTLLILIIVLNIALILSDKVLKKPYPSILDYTYLTLDKSDKYLGLNKDDLLILDIKKTFTNKDIVYYHKDNKYELAKVEEIVVENVKVKNAHKEENTTKGLIEGTVIITISKLGAVIDLVFSYLGLGIAIVILIMITIMENFMSKNTKQTKEGKKEEKPDFNKMKRYN